jgi:hypothetical protein
VQDSGAVPSGVAVQDLANSLPFGANRDFGQSLISSRRLILDKYLSPLAVRYAVSAAQMTATSLLFPSWVPSRNRFALQAITRVDRYYVGML